MVSKISLKIFFLVLGLTLISTGADRESQVKVPQNVMQSLEQVEMEINILSYDRDNSDTISKLYNAIQVKVQVIENLVNQLNQNQDLQ